MKLKNVLESNITSSSVSGGISTKNFERSDVYFGKKRRKKKSRRHIIKRELADK